MRTLRFIVKGQIITQDPKCDFSGLVPGSEGYIQAEFVFSPEWDGCAKVAGFYSNLGIEYEPQILKDGSTCRIPAEALKRRIFKVQILGQKKDYIIRTNKLAVEQKGDKV